MDAPRQVFRNLQIPLNECPVDRQLCRRWGQLLGSPAFHLPPHRLEVTLHPINTNRKAVFKQEVSRVSSEDRTIVPVKGEVVTHEHAQTDGAGQPEALVISIPDPDRESASIEAGCEIDHTEHFHTVF
jgi:hypothetical protein